MKRLALLLACVVVPILLRAQDEQADPSDFAGGHAMQNANISFVNRAFSFATTVPFPGHGFSAGVSVRPVDWWYATVAATNAYGNALTNDLPVLTKGDFFQTRGNLAGLAFGVSESAANSQTEKILEAFVRFQVTSFCQATVGVQGLFDAVNSSETAAAVFTGRMRVAF